MNKQTFAAKSVLPRARTTFSVTDIVFLSHLVGQVRELYKKGRKKQYDEFNLRVLYLCQAELSCKESSTVTLRLSPALLTTEKVGPCRWITTGERISRKHLSSQLKRLLLLFSAFQTYRRFVFQDLIKNEAHVLNRKEGRNAIGHKSTVAYKQLGLEILSTKNQRKSDTL